MLVRLSKLGQRPPWGIMYKAQLPILRTMLARPRTRQLRVLVAVRGYAQDVVRDPMTGELTSLPDIDVRVYPSAF